MKMKLMFAAAVFTLGAGLAVAQADDLMKRANEHFKAIPSLPPALKGNTVTREKVDLGKMLFFDPRLSSSHL
ncbi:MAG: hypothetical protein H7831_16030, partial [Magnetococcus sp. WYHC-3]